MSATRWSKSSEKINNVVEAPAAGVLRRRVAAEGDVLSVGGLMGVIADALRPGRGDRRLRRGVPGNVRPRRGGGRWPRTETVEVEGRRIQYLKMGEGGTPLIFIPGFAGDINIFVFNQEALSSDRAVYALDMPGHGRSAKDVGEGDLDFFAGVVAGFLDEMGIEKAHLAGHSIGGAIAGTFALAHPEARIPHPHR